MMKVQKSKLIKIIRDRRQNLRSNTHGCELTNTNIDNISFTENEIISIIRSLKHNKAHGWDGISIRMIKICDESIVYPLKIIFGTALKSGIFPEK